MSNDMLQQSSKSNIKTFEDKLNYLKNKKPTVTNIGGSIVKSGDVINEGDNQGILEGSLAQDNGSGRGSVIGGETWNKGLNTHHMKSGDVINTGMNQGKLQGGDTINEHTNNFGMYSGSINNDGNNESEMESGKSHNKGLNNNELIGSSLYNSGNNHKDAFIKGKDAVRNLQEEITNYIKPSEIIAQEEIKKIQHKLDTLDENIKNQKKELELKQNQFKKNNENAILDAKNLDDVKRNLSNVSQELSNTESQLNQKKEEIDNLTKNIDDKNLQIKNLSNLLDKQKSEVTQCESNLKVAKSEARKNKEELDNCKENENRLRRELQELQQLPLIPAQICTDPEDRLKKELSNITDKTKIAETLFEKTRTERNHCKREKDIAQEKKEKIKRSLDELKKTRFETKEELAKAQNSLRDISTSEVEQAFANKLNFKPPANEALDAIGINHKSESDPLTDFVHGGGLNNSGINNGTVKGGDTIHINSKMNVVNSVSIPLISQETVEQISSSSNGLRVKHAIIAEGKTLFSNVSSQANNLFSPGLLQL